MGPSRQVRRPTRGREVAHSDALVCTYNDSSEGKAHWSLASPGSRLYSLSPTLCITRLCKAAHIIGHSIFSYSESWRFRSAPELHNICSRVQHKTTRGKNLTRTLGIEKSLLKRVQSLCKYMHIVAVSAGALRTRKQLYAPPHKNAPTVCES